MARSPHYSTDRLSRRDFLVVSAAVGAGIMLPTAAAADSPTAVSKLDALDAVAGFIDDDANPLTSAVTLWGEHRALPVDINYRSIGIDLGAVRAVNAIELARDAAVDTTGPLPSAGSVLANDDDPPTGSFSSFRSTSPTALDYLQRSVGADLFAVATVRRIDLVARGVATRITAGDYTVWVSDDNVSYVPLTGWSLSADVVDGRLVHSFSGFEVQTRYLKVHTRFTDTAFTFVLENPSADFRVFGAPPVPESGPSHRLSSRDLSTYVSNDNRSWTKVRDVELVSIGTSLWLYGFSVRARYVKVHCHRGEQDGWTFLLADLQTGLRTYLLPKESFVGGGGGSWSFRTPVVVRNPHRHELRDRAVYIPFADLGVESLVAAGRLQPDLRDLRFATPDGAELHAYADGGGCQVRVPLLHPRQQLLVNAYSGNPAATNRVLHDTDALQVEYGQRTLVGETSTLPDGSAFGSALKAVRLPDGTMMVAASSPRNVGVHARFSSDGGRVWSEPERILPPTLPDLSSDGPGGFVVDASTGALVFFFNVTVAVNFADDLLDVEKNNVQQWVAVARSYTFDGRPVFGSPQRVPIRIRELDRPANWALTYANGIVTREGTYLLPVSYIIRSDGTFASAVVRSEDGGRTWQQSASELSLPGRSGFEVGITEVAVEELDDGSLLLLARTQAPQEFYFAISRSHDDGRTWETVSDSRILASNTAPGLSRDSERSLVLSWSGHNAFDQTSKFRNNLSAAFSDDDGQHWHGYHDLLGATMLSFPGWASTQESLTAVNADSAAVNDDERLFAWSSYAGGTSAYRLHIEDVNRYLKASHGALDAVSFRAAQGVGNGTELAAHRWWRTTRTGVLDLVEGRRPARRAIRMRVSPPGENEPIVPTEVGASRLFPAVRRASIRFSVRCASLGTPLHLCLQEGYSADWNARGTALSLQLTPAGELRATTDDTFGLIPDIGFLANDSDPATGRISNFGLHQVLAMDYQRRSIGADLFDVTEISGIQVVDNNLIGTAGNRVQPQDLRIWTSDTNLGDWQELTGWTGTKDGAAITVSGAAVSTRYVKVSHSFSDNAFTFANDQQRLLRVLPDRSQPQQFAPLALPTTLTAGEWHTVHCDVDLPNREISVSVDGTRRAILPQLHAAEVVTHLLLLVGDTDSPTDIAIDELVVQDTALGLPAVSRVLPTVQT